MHPVTVRPCSQEVVDPCHAELLPPSLERVHLLCFAVLDMDAEVFPILGKQALLLSCVLSPALPFHMNPALSLLLQMYQNVEMESWLCG